MGTNGTGTTNGSDGAFTTLDLPTPTTTAVSTITPTSATLGGGVSADGGAQVTEHGIVYSTTDTIPEKGDPGVTRDTNGSGSGEFCEIVTSLFLEPVVHTCSLPHRLVFYSRQGVDLYLGDTIPFFL